MLDTYGNPLCYAVCGYIALPFFSKQLQITLAKYSNIIAFTNFLFAGIKLAGFGLLNPTASSDFTTFSVSVLVQTTSPSFFRFVIITISCLLIAMSLSSLQFSITNCDRINVICIYRRKILTTTTCVKKDTE